MMKCTASNCARPHREKRKEKTAPKARRSIVMLFTQQTVFVVMDSRTPPFLEAGISVENALM
jgi:hypothetical protein